MIIVWVLVGYMVSIAYMFGWRPCTSWMLSLQFNKGHDFCYRLGVNFWPVEVDGKPGMCLSLSLMIANIELYMFKDDITA